MRKIKIITSAVILHQKIVFGAVKFTKHPGIITTNIPGMELDLTEKESFH